eukprot:CFRG5844T1
MLRFAIRLRSSRIRYPSNLFRRFSISTEAFNLNENRNGICRDVHTSDTPPFAELKTSYIKTNEGFDNDSGSEGEEEEDPFEAGHFSCRTMHLPDQLKSSIFRLVQGRSTRQMRKDIERLDYFLHTRTTADVDYEPLSKRSMKETRKELVEKLMNEKKVSKSKAQRLLSESQESETSLEVVDKRLHFGTKRSDGTTLLTSNTLTYGVNEGVAYAVGRLPSVYASTYRVFLEIYCRDYHWAPETVLDFGSGVGSTMWAAHALWESPTKYSCVDMSEKMNQIADFLNREENGTTIHDATFRRFMPVLNKSSYDLVTASFSLCELPSMEARKQAILSMWEQTSQYLIIIEPGTQEGFRNIREARRWVATEIDADLIAPCPHDDVCPMEDTEKICRFGQRVQYSRAQQEIMRSSKMNSNNFKLQTFNFLIVARKSHEGTSTVRKSVTRYWTRLTAPTMKRTGHVICDGCTSDATLKRTIRSRSQGTQGFKDTRKRKWGDLLPPLDFYDIADTPEILSYTTVTTSTTKSLPSSEPTS